MKLLVLGNSSIFQKRVFPVLQDCGITGLDIASASNRSLAGDNPLPGRTYTEYSEALQQSDAQLVYITNTNNMHAPLALEALRAGKHVIVDKPAVVDFPDAELLAREAEERNLCLAEATVYTFHPQIQRAREIFEEKGIKPTRISSVFSIPPLPESNFRYRKELGGGAILDTAPYALTPGRIYFGKELVDIAAKIGSTNGEVDTAYSILADFGDGQTLTGHFGFDTEYRNHIEILGEGLCVFFERAFTTTPDLKNTITILNKNTITTEEASAADSFKVFFKQVVDDIKAETFAHHSRTMLQDARAMNMLQKAAQ